MSPSVQMILMQPSTELMTDAYAAYLSRIRLGIRSSGKGRKNFWMFSFYWVTAISRMTCITARLNKGSRQRSGGAALANAPQYHDQVLSAKKFVELFDAALPAIIKP